MVYAASDRHVPAPGLALLVSAAKSPDVDGWTFLRDHDRHAGEETLLGGFILCIDPTTRLHGDSLVVAHRDLDVAKFDLNQELPTGRDGKLTADVFFAGCPGSGERKEKQKADLRMHAGSFCKGRARAREGNL